ncbi:uncharacterized protein TNCV_3648311 [Trichonephila clavipes]|nr:uncharacterized protein TNCV_3648311 [Trichonephila clavipes]
MLKEEFGCEKMVCLDTKTRWNSLLAMLERFLEIKSAISKALIDIKEEQMMVNVEFETVTTIVKGLKPVKIGLEKLCSRNATLLTAEGVFSFVIGELNEQNSEFAKNMKYSLIQRINERRNVNLIGLMQYLNFGRKYEAAAVTGDISRLPGKNCLVRQTQMIGTRLFCEEEESISNSSHSEEESIEILKEKPLTLDEKLEKAIYSKTKVLYCSTKKSTSFNKIMKQETQLFDSTENPSPNIIKLCDALKTIPPTSVEAERAFSTAGLFVTKLRTRLSDKSINCLCILKFYFKNE